MKAFFYILITLFLIYCQPTPVLCQSVEDFPQSWQGKWKGEMHIFSSGVLQQKLPMQLHILPTDSANIFTYRIIYGIDTIAGDRPYLLKSIDKNKGWYVCDEQNSIKIESYLLGNNLTSAYEVQGTFIYDILEKRGETLIWRLFSGSNQAVSITGGTKNGEEDIPPVKSYAIRVLQTAELKR
jgi:hypothetical protein